MYLRALVLCLLMFGSLPFVGTFGRPAHVDCQVSAVEKMLAAWKHEDWNKMYTFLSASDKKHVLLQDFKKKRQQMSIIENLDNYKINSEREASSTSVFVTVALFFTVNSYQGGYFPSKKSTKDKSVSIWHMVREDGSWKLSLPV